MTRQNKRFLLASASLAVIVGMAAPAAAQVAGTAAPAAEEIVVTGSRVLKNGNASPTPTTIVAAEQLLEIKPGPIAEALASLPVFDGSRTGVANPGSGTTNTGSAHLDIRLMGEHRTLVLFDGKRMAPSTFDQLVDIDTIPQMLLQRVDVVTGGVAAVYGSDAVAGVVNFVTDRNFNGLKLNAQAGISTVDDDPTQSIGFAAGRRVFDDKGHFEFSYQFQNDAGIPRRSDRENGQEVWTVFGAGTAASPLHLVENTRISTATFGGLITGATGAGAALNNMTFDSNGVLSPFVNGVETGTSGVQSGGDGAYYDSSLKASLQTHQLFARFDYDVNETTHAYVEAAYNVNKTGTFEAYTRLTNTLFNGQNAFLPPQDLFTGTFKLNELMQDLPRVTTNTTQDQYFVIAGLEGKLSGWTWNVAINQAQATSVTTNPAQVDNQKLSAALDAVRDSSGNIVCHVTVTNPGLYPGCVPLNPFGPTAASQAAINYISTPTSYTNINGMTDLSADIAGSPFSDWAGPVRLDLSGEWRRQTLQVNSTAQPTDLASCTGLTMNCTTGTTLRWADSVLASMPQVGMNVGELAAETEIPLLKDAPFVKDLSFNGAARYTDYSISGAVWSWKAGVIWEVNDEFKLRGTESRDIRAPTLYDLYQPLGVTVGPVLDLLTNLQVTVPTYTGGNPNLKPEIGNTATAGFVYQPTWLPRFSFSVDAFYINITNALNSNTGSGSGAQTLCNLSGGTNPICALIARPLGPTNSSAANAVTAFYSLQINIASSTTEGADFEANYKTTLAGNPLNLRALVTWQPHLTLITPGPHLVEGAGSAYPVSDVDGSSSLPVVRMTLFADYTVDAFHLSVREHWRSPLTMVATPGVIYGGPLAVPSVLYSDANLAYTLKHGAVGSTELYINVQNLFNVLPPPAGRGSATRIGTFGGFAAGDDPIGRYFTAGFRFRY